LIALAVTSSSLFAKPNANPPPKTSASKEKHEHHEAHVHGVAQLSIALESSSGGMIELHAPSESIFGFEHAPNGKKEEAAEREALQLLRAKIADYLGLKADLKCSVLVHKVEVEREHEDDDHDHEKKGHAKEHSGEHSEVEAEYGFKCEKPIEGLSLDVDFAKGFPRIQTLEVQVLKSSTQNHVTLKKGKGKVQL
jgi:hypothetical protein